METFRKSVGTGLVGLGSGLIFAAGARAGREKILNDLSLLEAIGYLGPTFGIVLLGMAVLLSGKN